MSRFTPTTTTTCCPIMLSGEHVGHLPCEGMSRGYMLYMGVYIHGGLGPTSESMEHHGTPTSHIQWHSAHIMADVGLTGYV